MLAVVAVVMLEFTLAESVLLTQGVKIVLFAVSNTFEGEIKSENRIPE